MHRKRDMADAKRKHRSATQAAMVKAVRYCKGCGRGQVPSKFDKGDGRQCWQCRYCQHEH